jgi:hypothetical protein
VEINRHFKPRILRILTSGVKTGVKENKYYVLWFSLHTAKVYLILPIKI